MNDLSKDRQITYSSGNYIWLGLISRGYDDTILAINFCINKKYSQMIEHF
jgi:hypothetical protein